MEKAQKGKYHYFYIIAATCFGIQAVGIGTFISYGILIYPLISEFGWSRASITGANLVAFLLGGVLSIAVGRLNDRIGPRKLMTVTSVFFGLGYLLMFRLDAIWQLYLFFGIIFGIGLSSIDVIALTTIARWFVRKRGIVTGMVKVGTGAGQMIIPFLVSILIINFGWRVSCFIIGVAVMILLVAIAQLLRRDPSEVGLSPDWNEEAPVDNSDLVPEGLSQREALHVWQFWTVCAANLTSVFCTMLVMIHIVPHAQDLQFSAIRAASVLSIIGGVSMAGRFICGFTIDRIGSKIVMLFSFMLLIVALLWLQIAKELWMLYLFAMIYGIGHGGVYTTISPMVAEFFGIKAHGVLFGIVVFSGTFGGALGPYLAGRIFDVTGGYSLAFWICTLMSALGFALIALLKPVNNSNKGDYNGKS